MKAKRKRALQALTLNTLTLALTGGLAAAIFLPMAWAERGFAGGIGGEWILIIGAFILGDYLYDAVVAPVVFGGEA